MPFVSQAQQRWGNSPAGRKALGKKGVAEWNASTKGKSLPEKVTKRYSRTAPATGAVAMLSKHKRKNARFD